MFTALAATLLVALVVQVPTTAGGQPGQAPQKKELFAQEEWYKSQKGQEQAFVGTLEKLQRAGIGFGRFNPFRLKMEATDGKTDVREVYVGSQPNLLEPYVGKKVRLFGKPVEMEVEGQNHREIWPARLERINVNTKTGSEGGKEDKERTPKVIAKAPRLAVNAKGNHAVICSGKDLLKYLPAGTTEEEATAQLTHVLNVAAIDWEKHMVVVISGGVRRTGGYSVQVGDLTIKDKVLTVHWTIKGPPPGGFVTQAITHPGATLLIERFPGEVRIDPPAPRPGLPK